jgi:CDP-diacylglycerol---serine O-phosphatidyltransferase
MSPTSHLPGADDDSPYSASNASRIYFLPNLMTAGNLFCGFVACIKCIQAHYFMRGTTGIPPESIVLFSEAVWFIFGAMAFDMLDGRLARMGGRESLFGAEFDSLADIVSFGLAPALMVFFLILSPTQGYPVFTNIGWFLGFIYLLCAAIRLARFNVLTHPLIMAPEMKASKDFVGLPVPAAAGTVAALVLFLLRLASAERTMHKWALGLPILMVLIAILMISTIRYPSGKQVDLQTKTRLTSFVIFLSVAAAVIIFKEIAMLLVMLGYVFFGLGRHVRRQRAAARARRRATV